MKWLRSVSLSTLSIVVFAALATFAIGWYASRYETLTEVAKNTPQPVRYEDSQYPLISPLVSVAIPNATGFPELAGVKNDVSNIIQVAEARGDTSDVGVYFRLPANAHWFGINENDKFSPGSLTKVPIMMAFLKEAESNPKILDEELYYNSALVADIPDALPAQLPTGRYSGERLLQTMIIQSDNVAKEVLFDAVGISAIQDVFNEMNINFLDDPTGTISPKAYTVIFSRIYNATYLNRYYSNYAMNLLNETTFKDGLVAGLPSDVKVAHKYGESGIYAGKILTDVELHDCGLVYATGEPYYLCVMTKGKNTATLANLIKSISAAVYQDRGSFKPAN
jgi:beta-lactamase class A